MNDHFSEQSTFLFELKLDFVANFIDLAHPATNPNTGGSSPRPVKPARIETGLDKAGLTMSV